MTSILDAQVHAGLETAYNTSAAPTRSFEAHDDGHSRTTERLTSQGFRAGMQGLGATRVRTVTLGASGALTVDVLTASMGLLLQAALGTSTNTQEMTTGTTPTATGRYIQTHATDGDGPAKSVTLQIVRPTVDGAETVWDYAGGIVTGFELTQETKANLQLKLDLDYAREILRPAGTVPAAAAYAPDAVPFGFEMASLTWGGAPIAVQKFGVTVDHGMDTERHALHGSATKRQPRRNAVPTVEGEMEAEFEDVNAYTDFVSGRVAALVATWIYDDAATGLTHEFRVELPAVSFTGTTPEVSLSDLPRQTLPFEALHNGTDPVLTVTYITTDTSF